MFFAQIGSEEAAELMWGDQVSASDLVVACGGSDFDLS